MAGLWLCRVSDSLVAQLTKHQARACARGGVAMAAACWQRPKSVNSPATV